VAVCRLAGFERQLSISATHSEFRRSAESDPLRTLAKRAFLYGDVIERPPPPFYLPARWEAVSLGVGAFLGYLLFAYVLGEGRGTIAGVFFGCIGLVVRITWPLRGKAWFWLLLFLLTALHTGAVVAFDWSAAARWSGLTVMPLMAADISMTMTVIYVAYSLICGVPAQLFTSSALRYAEDVD